MSITLTLGFLWFLRHFLGFNPNSRVFWSFKDIFLVLGLFWGILMYSVAIEYRGSSLANIVMT